MSTFAYRPVVAPQLRWVTASAPFHVCERSGFSPDRADYLHRRAKLNFTSLERHHKASLSSSLPRSPNEPTPTYTHPHTRTQSQKASLTDIHGRKPVTCRRRPNLVLSNAMWPPPKSANEDGRQSLTLQISKLWKTKPERHGAPSALLSSLSNCRGAMPAAGARAQTSVVYCMLNVIVAGVKAKPATSWLQWSIMGKNLNL